MEPIKLYHIYYIKNHEMIHKIVSSDEERKDLIYELQHFEDNISYICCIVEWRVKHGVH